MALFQNWYQPTQTHHTQSAQTTQPQKPARAPALLPAFMQRITPLCHDHSHPLPVTMLYNGDSMSHRGQPMANYRCPICSARQAWVIDFHTGQPRHLFSRPGR